MCRRAYAPALLLLFVGCSLDRAPLPDTSRAARPGEQGAGSGGVSGAAGSGTATAGASGSSGSGGSGASGGHSGSSGAGGSSGTGGMGGAGGAGSGGPADPGCTVHCDDGVFCDGLELCLPADPAADVSGCVKVPPNCQPAQTCDEAMQRCVTRCAVSKDADADGSDAIDCGGDDCNDAVSQINPDAVDVCNGVDDDCDGSVDNGLGAVACLLPSAAGTCNAGRCQVVACLTGAQDCDGVSTNGCEVVDMVRGDCKRKDCSGKTVVDDTDVPLDDGEECTLEECNAGVPLVRDAPDGTTCGDGGQCQSGNCKGG